jgi:hypothetical protein
VILELRDKIPTWTLSRAELHALLTFSTKDPGGRMWMQGVYLLYEPGVIAATNGARMLTVRAPGAQGIGGKTQVTLSRGLLKRLFWVMDDQDQAEIVLSEGRSVATLVHQEDDGLVLTMAARTTGNVPERITRFEEVEPDDEEEAPLSRIRIGHRYLADLTKLLPVLGDTLELRFFGDELSPFVIRGKAKDGSIWCATVMPKRGEIDQ